MDKTLLDLTVNNVPLAASVDGHQLSFDSQNKVADLLFFQINPNSFKDGHADGIAAGRVRLTIEQLQKLGEDILDAVKKNG